MSDPYKAPELVEPRSNPSEAERGRKLPKGEKIKYQCILITGLFLLIAGPITITLLATGHIPGKYQFLAFVSLMGIFLGLFLTDIGVTKGQDKRHHRGIND